MAKSEGNTSGPVKMALHPTKGKTTNAWRFEEVGDDGKPKGRAFCKIGTQYVPQATFGEGVEPKTITVTTNW